MLLDGHIHISPPGQTGGDSRKIFMEKAMKAGIEGGLVISQPPCSNDPCDTLLSNEQRLNDLLDWCGDSSVIYPFYWINPLEDDAQKQIDKAVAAGVMGFKVICSHFYPSDPAALNTFRYIAENNKPILFHSGILWDDKASSQYNKPAAFEALIEIPNLRFALAHISWPWCDEHIAVYGKFLSAFSLTKDVSAKKDVSAEMFIDITPGTPEIYRREALSKIFTIGYDVGHNVIFGSDSYARNYNHCWTRKWLGIDNEIYNELGLSSEIIASIYSENLKRFVGISSAKFERKPLRQGE